MKYPHFIGASYQSQAVTADAERTINWYVELLESPGATVRSALYPTPGVTEIGSVNAGPGRAHFEEDGQEWAVEGAGFYEIDKDGDLTLLGAVAIDENPATISSNGDTGELFITSGGNGYLYDKTTETFSTIAALDGKATMGAHLDGYFVALDADSSTFYISALLDGTTWDTGTQFAARSAASDPWKSMAVANRYLWLYGSATSEVWFNAGTSPFPFELHPAGLLPFGIAGAFTRAVCQGVVYWLASSGSGTGMVMRSSGFSPERISTIALELQIQQLSSLSGAYGDAYDELGHTFYLLTIPSAKMTWAYDAQTQLWCERGTWDETLGEWGVWRPTWHALAFGCHRWLDSASGAVYESGIDYYTDAGGGVIRRVRRGPTLSFENQRLFMSSFSLDLEPGLGTQTGQGANPQVMMRMSNDGGKTWGSELWRAAGAAGKYGQRVIWNRLGSARRRCIEVSVTDPIPWRVTSAYVEMAQPPEGMSRMQQMQWGS